MQNRADRIIIDTNLWISFLITKDYSNLDTILSERRAIIVCSKELIDEFTEVASRPKFKKYFHRDDIQRLTMLLATEGEFIDVVSEIDICRDPKDNFLLSLARDGKTTHLITGDNDLLEIKYIDSTLIVTMTNYLRSIKKGERD